MGGLAEEVHDGKTGFVVPAGNVEALKDAMKRYFLESRHKEFSKNIIKNKQHHTWDGMAQTILSFFQDETGSKD